MENIRSITFKGQALIHNDEQGKDYLEDVEVTVIVNGTGVLSLADINKIGE